MESSNAKFLVTNLLLKSYAQMLRAVSAWLDKAEKDELVSRRLAPDMFPLSTQICFICLQSQEALYRLQGKEIPQALKSLADMGRSEQVQTIQDAKTKIDEALLFLSSFDASTCKFLEKLTLELPGGIVFENITAVQYTRDWAIPQFYFHVVTAYLILRNAGIDLGKADYVAHMFAYLKPTTSDEHT
mmetsp:Transcript_16018/g.44094  ORF Transcript_16018/g.44094 Transcript_16018/m.44094 type:complete len:187 (-) Transcript_16018:184-744(-)|eukprot:CAMPEP_0168717570 /NCGR_PEP_ID=MMETSP0724-20121128/68_1 /TAXON_ID=265536 /ORGANISM="Amphiprora sp., Strain CCMP467" /LENGTH=186 /DNA_ID=CAMNT_0008764051 /DNA_START=24 /DNA_END=584 /DNA_ORIENTATION=-